MKINIKKWFRFEKFRNALVGKTHMEDTKLNGLSIFFLVLFNIFIFFNLSDGMSSQSKNIASPYEYTPYNCRDIFDNFSKNPTYYYKSLSSYRDSSVSKNSHAPSYDSDFKVDKASSYCQQLSTLAQWVKNDTQFSKLFNEIKDLETQLSSAQSKKYSYEQQYNNFRDDYRAGLGSYNNRIWNIDEKNIRSDYESILARIESLESQIKQKQQKISQIPSIVSIDEYVKNNQNTYNKDKEKYEYWYPVKVTLLQIILIFPILIVSLFLLSFAVKRQNKILSILGSNIALISGIFALFIVFKIIYWLFPHTLLQNIFLYLSSIKALAIWNYLLVIFGIILFGTLMYFSQKFFDKWKKLKAEQLKRKQELNKDKVLKQRFWDKKCMNCDTQLLPGAKCCGNCGFHQYDICKKCKHETPKCYVHCDNCGEKK